MALTRDPDCAAEEIGSPQLMAILRTRFAKAGEVLSVSERERLGRHVYRLRLEANGRPRSVVVKRLELVLARRVELVAEHWLPAVGLQDAGPPLVGVARGPDAQYAWHAYEDLGDCILNECAPDEKAVAAAMDLIAELHVRFANHPLLGECREWAGDAGMHFYRKSAREAFRIVAALTPPDSHLTERCRVLRDRICAHLKRLLDEEPWRARLMSEFAGPDTLLHGDLWPKNTIVYSSAGGTRVRFVDWDRVRVGPVAYDLSAFISRMPAGVRASVVDSYRQAVGRAGWRLPSASALDVLFTTAESARLANCAIWPPLAAITGEADWEWALGMLAAIDEWFNALRDNARSPVSLSL